MAKNSYIDIQQQIARLQEQAEALKAKEVAGVIARIKEAISAYNLTAADLGLAGTKSVRAAKAPQKPAKSEGPKAGKTASGKVAVKFRDTTGNTWTGRGLQPRWLKAAIAAGKSLDDFRV